MRATGTGPVYGAPAEIVEAEADCPYCGAVAGKPCQEKVLTSSIRQFRRQYALAPIETPHAARYVARAQQVDSVTS